MACVLAVPPAKANARSFYQPELDSLRFLAFLGVFFFHAMPQDVESYTAFGPLAPWLVALWHSGAFGVDLFFTLSAFLITSLLLKEKEQRGRLDVKRFYVRRILRIWPLYFAFIGLVLALQPVTRAQHLSIGYVLGYLLLAGNWTYVVWGVPNSMAAPLWSVSIEEQFYLLWPLAVRVSGRRFMAVLSIFLLIAANLTRLVLVAEHAPERAMEYNTLCRLGPIALGILLALLLPDARMHLTLAARLSLFSAASGIWLICGRYCGFNSGHVNQLGTLLGRPAISLASAAMLISFLGTGSGMLRSRALTYLGKISYGLYVFHELALRMSHRLTDNLGAARAALALGVTILLVAASYRFWERPFLLLKGRFSHIPSRPT